MTAQTNREEEMLKDEMKWVEDTVRRVVKEELAKLPAPKVQEAPEPPVKKKETTK